MKNNFLAFIAIILSLIAIGLTVLRVTPMVEFENDTYIGIIATLIGISVSLLVGYQIYNAVELKEELKELRNLANTTEGKGRKLDERLNLQELSMQEGFYTILAVQKYAENKNENGFIAFQYMLQTLIYSLKLNRKEYEGQILLLNEYISNINVDNFALRGLVCGDIYTDKYDGEQKSITDILNPHINSVNILDDQIRESENFFILKKDYNKAMELFWSRIEKIKNDPSNIEEQNKIPEELAASKK